MIDLQRKNAIINHCSDFTSCWFSQIQTFPSAKLSFCSWCLCNKLADYFKESSVRDCRRPVYQILEKWCVWLKYFWGRLHHRGFLSLTFLTRGFLGSSSHLPFILAALLAARYSSSVTSSLKQLLKIKVERLSITRDLTGLLSNIWVSPGRIFSS